MNEKRYYKYSEYLKTKYHKKVYKIPVNLPVSCPVRDGSIDYAGCIFCGEDATGYEMHSSRIPIKEQIVKNIDYISDKYAADYFEIYFQNFTNTYLPPHIFHAYIKEALEAADSINILTISTRPDCIAEEYLDILKEVSEFYHIDITIELGLQSVNPNTLHILNRGHTLAEYLQAVLMIKKYGFQVCTHLITTLPWDSDDDIIEAAKIISVLDTDSVKLHTLYVEEGTELASMYLSGDLELLSIDDYVKRTVDFIEYLKPDIAIQRLSARVPSNVSLFANWGRSHWVLTDLIDEELLKRNGYQGRLATYGCNSQVRKFLGGDDYE